MISTSQAKYESCRKISRPPAHTVNPGCPCRSPQSLDLDRCLYLTSTFVTVGEARQAVSSKSGKRFPPNGDLYVTIVLPLRTRSMRLRTGHFLRSTFSRSDQLDKPIHLLLRSDGRYLFLEAAVTIQFSDMTFARTPRRFLSRQNTVRVDGPAGMAFSADGFLYVASRNTRKSSAITKDRRPSSPFIKNLADDQRIFDANQLNPVCSDRFGLSHSPHAASLDD